MTDINSFINVGITSKDAKKGADEVVGNLNRIDKANKNTQGQSKKTGEAGKKANDKIASSSGAAATGQKALGNTATATGAKVKASGASGATGMKGLAAATSGATASMQGLNSAFLANPFIALGASVAVLGKQFLTFEQSIADLSAITGATGKDLQFFSGAARELGSVTTLSASQVADAFRLVASAKPDLLESAEALKEVTAQAITLAEAAGISVPEAANTMASALNQFGAEADQAAKFTDILAAGSKFGAASIAEMGEAMKNAGTTAASLGVGFDETNAALQLLSTRALKGGEAGTQLRGVLLGLETKTKDFRPSVIGISEALRKFGEAGYTTGEQLKIFGRINLTAGQILTTNADAFDTLNEKVNISGIASEQAGIRTATFYGQIKLLGSALEELGATITSDAGLGGAMTGLVSSITFFVETLSSAITFVDKFVGIGNILGVLLVSKIVPAMAALAISTASNVLALGGYIAAQIAATAAMGAGAVAAATLSTAMALVGGPLGVAVIAAAAIYTYASGLETAKERSKRLQEESKTLTSEIENVGMAALGAKQQLNALRIVQLSADIRKAKSSWLSMGSGLKVVTKETKALKDELSRLIGENESIGEQLRESFGSGMAVIVANMTDEIAKLGHETGLTGDELKDYLEGVIDVKKALEESTKVLGLNARQLSEYNAIQAAGINLSNTDRDSIIALNKTLFDKKDALDAVTEAAKKTAKETIESQKAMADAAEKEAERLERPWLEAINRIDGAFAEAWTGAFDSFSSFKDRILDGFKQLLAELAHMAISKPIIVSILSGASSAFGGESTGAGSFLADAATSYGGSAVKDSVLGEAGFAGLFKEGGLTKAYENVTASLSGFSDSVSSFFGGGSSTQGIQGVTQNAAGGYDVLADQGLNVLDSAVTIDWTNIGANLGAGIVGGLVGTKVGESLFGKTAGSSWGATAGAAIGAYLGAGSPLFTGIGAAIGGMVDAAFGSSLGPAYSRFSSDLTAGAKVNRDNSRRVRDHDTSGIIEAGFGDYRFNTSSDFLGGGQGQGETQAAEIFAVLDAFGALESFLASTLVPEKVAEIGSAIGEFDEKTEESLDIEGFFASRFGTIFDTIGGSADDLYDHILSTLGDDELLGSLDRLVPTLALVNSATGDLKTVFDSLSEGLGQSVAGVEPIVINVNGLMIELNQTVTSFGSESSKAIQGLAIEGELLSETWIRLGTNLLNVNGVLDSIGISAFTLDEAGILASDALLNMAGGAEALVASASSFHDLFVETRDDITILGDGLKGVFSDLGATLPETRIGFRDLVQGLDLTTAAGQRSFITFTGLAGAADTYYTSLENAIESTVELSGATEGLSAGLRKAKDEFDAVTQGIKNSITLSVSATDTAMDALEKSVQAEKSSLKSVFDADMAGIQSTLDSNMARIKTRFDTEMVGVKSAFDANVSSIQNREKSVLKDLDNRISSVTDSVSKLKGLTSSIDKTISSIALTDRKSRRNRRAKAQSEIVAALSIAQSGGSLQNVDLSSALKTIAEPSADLYGSFTDYMRDFQVTNNQLSSLNDEASKQLSSEEAILGLLKQQKENVASDFAEEKAINQFQYDDAKANLQSQFNESKSIAEARYNDEKAIRQSQYEQDISFLDMQLQEARTQVDLLRGIDTSVLSVTSAVASLSSAMAVERSVPARQIEVIYREELGRASDIAGSNFYQDQLNSGESLDDIRAAINFSPEGKSYDALPAFADGGYHSGGSMLVGEEGPEILDMGPSSVSSNKNTSRALDNKELVKEIKALREQMRSDSAANLTANKKTAKLLENWDGDGMPAERIV